MKRFLRSFRRLKWKLTASYTLVTVATLLVLQLLVLGVGVVVLVELADRMPNEVIDRMSDDLAPAVSPYLAGEAPDLAGIHGWLTDPRRLDAVAVGGDITGLQLDIVDRDDQRTRLLVVDAAGRLLGDSRLEAAPGEPQPLDPETVPGLRAPLARALEGDRETGALYQLADARRLTFTAPIRGADGSVIGALVLSGPITPAALAVGVSAITVVAVSAVGLVLFTLAAGMIGTVLGFFTARRLSRRFDRMSAAAAAWGQGDFSQLIDDRSADEVGQLGRRLNGMASDLGELFQTRQQLSAVEERNRLARELHDSVKQQVFATSMNLAAARALWEQDPAAARARLESASELVKLSQDELTSVIQTLRPVQLEDKGLGQALAEHVARWREQMGIEAVFESRCERPLPLPMEAALLRVAQEALSNVARHSHATAARVALAVCGGEVVLAVADNGRGFDARARSGGVGLHSMRERVEALGGSLRIESGAAGTSMTARVPLEGGRRA